MAAVTITKTGSSFTIANYSSSGASTSIQTFTNPTGVKVWITGTTVNLDIADYPAFAFNQSLANSKVAVINGVDTTAYTAAQIKTTLDTAFSSGFSGNGGLVIQKSVILNLTTSVTGANFVLFVDSPCTSLDIINITGTTLEYRQDGAGLTMYIPDQSSNMIEGITNANQIGVRRVDVSGTQVTITARAITA